MDVEGKAAFKRALADVAFDGAKSVQLKVEAGVDDDRHVFDCTLQQLPCGLFVVSYTRTPARTVKLSPRELQIVHAECQDEPMKVTAKRLNVSLKTIEAHRANVRRKTETTGPATLTRWAIEHGHVAH
jgi:DNA-binding NarL/FixJ family response regulator